MPYTPIGHFESALGFPRKQDFKKPVTFYDRVRFIGADSTVEIFGGVLTGDIIISGDIKSGNWDGASDDLSSGAVAATLGYLLDYGSGRAQFETIYANGGTFDSITGTNMTITGVLNATTGTLGDVDITGDLVVDTGDIFTSSSSDRLRIGSSGADRTFIQWLDGTTDRASIGVGTGTYGIMTFIAAESGTVPAGQTVFEFGSSSGGWGNGVIDLYVGLENKSSVERWRGPDGLVATPGFAFANDPDTGMYRYGLNNLAFAAGGVRIMGLDASGIWLPNGGSAATPAIRINDSDTGLYRLGANTLGISAGGTQAMDIRAASILLGAGYTNNAKINLASGANAAAPTYAFFGDTDTGVYRPTSNQWSVACGGSQSLLLGTVGMNSPRQITFLDVYSATQTASAVHVDSSGRLRRTSSARKYKRDIDYDPQLTDIVLRPVSYIEKSSGQALYSLIADDLAAQDSKLGIYHHETGEIEDFVDRGVLAILAAKVNDLEARLAELTS